MNKSTLVTGPILLSLLCMTLIVASFSWYQAAAGEITVSGESSVSVTVSKPDDLYIAVANKWATTDTTVTVSATNYSINSVTLADFEDNAVKTAFSSINLRQSVVKYSDESCTIHNGSGAYAVASLPTSTKTPLVAPSTTLTVDNIDTASTFHSCIFGTANVSPVHFRFYVKNLYSSTQTRYLKITPASGSRLAIVQTTNTSVKTLYVSDYLCESGVSSSLTSVTLVNDDAEISDVTVSTHITPTTGVYSLDLSGIPSGAIYTYDIYLWCDGYKSTSPTAERFISTADENYPDGIELTQSVSLVIDDE